MINSEDLKERYKKLKASIKEADSDTRPHIIDGVRMAEIQIEQILKKLKELNGT